jgi:hypothetical protein
MGERVRGGLVVFVGVLAFVALMVYGKHFKTHSRHRSAEACTVEVFRLDRHTLVHERTCVWKVGAWQ